MAGDDAASSSELSSRYSKNASIISSSSAKPTSIASVRNIASIITWKDPINRWRTWYFQPQKLKAPRSRRSNWPNPKRFHYRASAAKNGSEACSSTMKGRLRDTRCSIYGQPFRITSYVYAEIKVAKFESTWLLRSESEHLSIVASSLTQH